MIRRLIFSFSHNAKHYSEVLPPHLTKILMEDENLSISKYESCRNYLSKMIENAKAEEDCKMKANLLFSTHCFGEALDKLKPAISQLIIDGIIRSQYELDQVGKWLNKQIKVNKDLNKSSIQNKLNNRAEQLEDFQQHLTLLNNQQSIDLNQTCKSLREKYFTIDSKTIYERVAKISQSKGYNQSSKKQNKLWDKLLQIKPRRIRQQCNSKQVYEQHLKITQGKLRFRFPPQPNGYLHIGHVKSIRINFESAKHNGGTCYLRYDDTNPDKQTHEFIEEIEENVRWLGYTPDKITYASDYFENLLFYANTLIKKGHAYVCDSSQGEIEHQRRNKLSNPFRNRSTEESLKIFPNLQLNQTLRLKWLPDAANPTLRDPIMYRLKNKPHPRTGDKYKIYPMYDFTHCISDSIEHIDYSLCSLEFEIRRELYYIFLDLLGLYKPTVWEYSRLNIEGNVLSKRKIKELIENKTVDGWDDPRLLTIRGLRNRGYTPQMLKEFIDKVNCSRAGNENIIQYNLLEKQMKKILLKEAPKTMAVLKPVAVTLNGITALDGSSCIFRPQSTVFLEQQDIQKAELGGFVILKSLGVFKIMKKDHQFVELQYVKSQSVASFKKANPTTRIIHWIPLTQSQTFPITLYQRLILPNDSLNPNSKTIYQKARVPLTISSLANPYIQLQRIGFFKLSPCQKQLGLCTSL